MSRVLITLCLLLAVSPLAAGEDPTQVDPDHYKVVFENDEVRVLRITYGPGEKSVMHYHPDGVAVFLNDQKVRFTMPDGSTQEVESKAGEAAWIPGGDHNPENLTDKSLEVILVEMKSGNGGD
jgi:quercetin dioxygenase-like cupin family protein